MGTYEHDIATTRYMTLNICEYMNIWYSHNAIYDFEYMWIYKCDIVTTRYMTINVWIWYSQNYEFNIIEYEYDIRWNIRDHIHNVQIWPRKTASWSCRFCFPFCACSCLARAALELLVQCIAFRIVFVWRHGKAVEYRHAGFATDPVKMRILQLDGNKHRRTVPERSAPKCLRRWVYML
jgi:hypothetical protein